MARVEARPGGRGVGLGQRPEDGMEGQRRAPAGLAAAAGTLPSRNPRGPSPPWRSWVPGTSPRRTRRSSPHAAWASVSTTTRAAAAAATLRAIFRSAASAAAESFGGLRGQPSITRHFRSGKHRLPRPGCVRIGWCGRPTWGSGAGLGPRLARCQLGRWVPGSGFPPGNAERTLDAAHLSPWEGSGASVDSGRASKAPPAADVLCCFRALSGAPRSPPSRLRLLEAWSPPQAAPRSVCDGKTERNRQDTWTDFSRWSGCLWGVWLGTHKVDV